MLVFRQHEVHKILYGSKTAMRRLSGKYVKGKTYKAGVRYGENGIFAILVITEEPYLQALEDMTPQDARDEGGYTLHDCKSKTGTDKIYARVCCNHCKHRDTCYQHEWIMANGMWRPNEKVWVVNFELLKENDPKHWAVASELGRDLEAVA